MSSIFIFLNTLSTKVKAWLVAIISSLAILSYTYYKIRGDAVDEYITKQNEAELGRLKERNSIEHVVDELSVDDTISRLWKSGWLRGDE